MKRRSFIKKLPILAGAPFVLQGIPFQKLYSMPELQKMAMQSTNENIMVIVQLHGGNDGLNTVIPINQYAEYYNLRPNIAIPDNGINQYIRLDNTVPDNQLVGLHPELRGLKTLYDNANLNIIQNVGYPNMNGSHFRGRDIWFAGVGPDERIESGWMGRFLEYQYEVQFGFGLYPEQYPNANMEYPLGLEFSTDVSLGFHTNDTIPAGISIPDPENFFDKVINLEGYREDQNVDPRGIPPEESLNSIPSLYREHLEWILDLEEDTEPYAEALQRAYQKGGESGVEYPDKYPRDVRGSGNPLGRNFQRIARLIAGGCKTKIYLLRIGGFDTHINQVEAQGNPVGNHSRLMFYLGESLKVFQDDLKKRGIDRKVLTATISEFGRQATSNANFGSDHGTVAPMLLMGTQVTPGITGINPQLDKIRGNQLSDRSEDGMIDYRIVFNTILQDWFGVTPAAVSSEIFKTMQLGGLEAATDKLPLIGNNPITTIDQFNHRRFHLEQCYPNPVKSLAVFAYYIDNPAHVKLGLYDGSGRLVKMLIKNEFKNYGRHEMTVDLSDLKPGVYYYKVEGDRLKATKKLVKL